MAETITMLPSGNLSVNNFFVPFIDTSRTEVIKIWKPVKGFEGHYEVSNYGEARSLDRWVDGGLGRRRFEKGCIMPAPVNWSNYRAIRFINNKEYKDFLLHRVIAAHFVPNPRKKPVVNHKNGNKLDCAAWNLEWATHSENNKHAYDTGLKVGAFKGVYGADHPNSKVLLQYDLSGNLIREWVSAAVAGRELNIKAGCIRDVCLGHSKTFKGFIWKYKK